MSGEGSNRAYELWRDSAEKFDYFMAGLSAALVGYVAPTFEPTKVGFNAGSLELLAILALVGSAFAGFKRIETTVHLQRVGIGKLEQLESLSRLDSGLRGEVQVGYSETGGVMSVAKLQELVANRKTLLEISKTLEKSIRDKAERWYRVRYYLLLAGFVILLASRIWKGYA